MQDTSNSNTLPESIFYLPAAPPGTESTPAPGLAWCLVGYDSTGRMGGDRDICKWQEAALYVGRRSWSGYTYMGIMFAARVLVTSFYGTRDRGDEGLFSYDAL